ncbi:DUF6233 domain-containing protein [Streptomyces sp. NPDC101062]
MFDLPPDLDRLRVLEHQLQIWAGHVRQAIVAAEKREAAESAARTRAAANLDRFRPPAADWTVEWILGTQQPLTIHVGDCHMPGHTGPISREEARRLITGGVEACQFCRPDTVLGV